MSPRVPAGRTARSPRPARIAVLLACAVLAACGSDIRGQPGAAGAVVTYRAPGAPFAGLSTVALVSQVGLVTTADGTKVFASAPALRAALAAALQARGFTLAAEVDPASPPAQPPSVDLLVNVTALEATDAAAAYWLTFAGYSRPADLGLPGYDWAYPWTWEAVQVLPGSLLLEISRPGARVAGSGGAPGQVPVLWAAMAHGVAPGGSWDGSAALEALARALDQSPYLAP